MNDFESTAQTIQELLEQLSRTHEPLNRLKIIGELTDLQQTFTLHLKSARADDIYRLKEEKNWTQVQVAESLGLTKGRITQILKTASKKI